MYFTEHAQLLQKPAIFLKNEMVIIGAIFDMVIIGELTIYNCEQR